MRQTISAVSSAAFLSCALLAALVFAAPAQGKDSGKDNGRKSGGVLPGASAQDPLNIDAGKLDFYDKEQKLVYTGSVIVVNGPSTLKATRLTIFLEKTGGNSASDDRVKHIDADGPVTLVTEGKVGSGDHATYNKADNKVHLTGNVTLTEGDNVVKGERLDYDVATGVASVQGGQGGRVRSIFTPKSGGRQ